MKFYKRDPNAAIAGMAELSLKQRGAYNSILDLLYAADGDVPDDDQRVARMISCHWREWAAVKRELIAVGKLWLEGGKIMARRVQDTVKEASRFSQEQSKRASSGWQKRKNANEIKEGAMPPGNASTATATATATPIEVRTDANASVPRARRQAHGTRVSEEFQPNDTSLAAQRELGFRDEQTPGLVAEFKDFWRGVPGSRGLKSDWQGTYRNRLREVAGRKAVNGHGRANSVGDRGHQPNTISDGIAAARAVIDEQRRREREGSGTGGANILALPGIRQGAS